MITIFNVELSDNVVNYLKKIYKNQPMALEALDEEVLKRQKHGSMMPKYKTRKSLEAEPPSDARHIMLHQSDGSFKHMGSVFIYSGKEDTEGEM